MLRFKPLQYTNINNELFCHTAKNFISNDCKSEHYYLHNFFVLYLGLETSPPPPRFESQKKANLESLIPIFLARKGIPH